MKKAKIVKAYKADMDGFYSNIAEVQIDKTHIDNYVYFKTFNAAKKYVMAQLKDMIVQYKNNLAEIKALTVDSFTNGSI
jgi:hypothetical protein